jgi:hypothetical protein
MKYELPRSVVKKIALDADLDPEEDLRFDYSGRFMYGDKCFGIVGDTGCYTKFMMMLYANPDTQDISWEIVDDVRTDSMGYDTIFYFPGVTVVDDEEDED